MPSNQAIANPFLGPPRLFRTRKLIGHLGSRIAGTLSSREDERALRILTYHRVNDSHPGDRLSVDPNEFRRQMKELADSGRPIVRLEQAVRALKTTDALPSRAVAVTFDDGYRDNFDCALPILEEFGVPATFFVATSFIGVDRAFPRYDPCCNRDGFMSWDHVSKIASKGHEIGGHSRSHRELGGLSAAEVVEEVEGCREDIRASTGVDARLFCYPRGSEGPEIRKLVRQAGFEGACTVSPGPNRSGAPPFGLTRTEVSGEDGLQEFRLKLDGAFDAWHRLVQRVQSWRHR